MALSPDGERLAVHTVDRNEKHTLMFGEFAGERSTRPRRTDPFRVWPGRPMESVLHSAMVLAKRCKTFSGRAPTEAHRPSA